MRDPCGAELLLFARCLMTLPEAERAEAARRMLRQVEMAADHLNRTGQVHPAFGDGSLMARCHRLDPAAEPLAFDRDFLLSLSLASRALLTHFDP